MSGVAPYLKPQRLSKARVRRLVSTPGGSVFGIESEGIHGLGCGRAGNGRPGCAMYCKCWCHSKWRRK